MNDFFICLVVFYLSNQTSKAGEWSVNGHFPPACTLIWIFDRIIHDWSFQLLWFSRYKRRGRSKENIDLEKEPR